MNAVLQPWIEGSVAVLLVLGSLSCLAGAIALWRLPRPEQRLHAPTLMASLGGACLAVACTLWALDSGARGLPLLVYGLLLVTTPLSGQALMRAIERGRTRPAQDPTPASPHADGDATSTPASSTFTPDPAAHALPRSD